MDARSSRQVLGMALGNGVKGIGSTLATVLFLVAGCGSGRPAPAADRIFVSDAGSDGDAAPEAGTKKPPGCGVQNDGSYCDCVDVPVFTEAPNIYFVLDGSGSMAEDNKWIRVRDVAVAIVRGIGSRANFGATVFPSGGAFSCDAGNEILAIQPGDPPFAENGPTARALDEGMKYGPNGGGTSTSATLQAVLPILTAARGKTFAILATDGAPNCNPIAECTVEQCQPNIDARDGCPPAGPSCCGPPGTPSINCNDTAATTSAVAALKSAGIPVFVVGLPGSAAYGSILDQLAVAGGTALPGSPNYYRVDSTATSAELLATLKKVAARIVGTCELTLKQTPTEQQLVNVYLDDLVLPQDPTNGWKIEGSKVTLLGTACARVLGGDVFDVRIITGCPTVAVR